MLREVWVYPADCRCYLCQQKYSLKNWYFGNQACKIRFGEKSSAVTNRYILPLRGAPLLKTGCTCHQVWSWRPQKGHVSFCRCRFGAVVQGLMSQQPFVNLLQITQVYQSVHVDRVPTPLCCNIRVGHVAFECCNLCSFSLFFLKTAWQIRRGNYFFVLTDRFVSARQRLHCLANSSLFRGSESIILTLPACLCHCFRALNETMKFPL